MAQRDPLGYYVRLGISPSATSAEVKAAYRARAMELHPDRNQGRDTTRQFQELQQAYEVLSNSETRSAYDAFAVDPAASRSESTEPTRYDPIYCSRCNCVSAMPRYRVFYSVFGYIFGATKSPHQGIFCARCEAIVAIRSTATTIVAGWWSIHGFFWSIEAILKNLVGGPSFFEQDARLLAYQAGYFESIGKTQLARAVATQAFKLASKVGKPNSKIARTRAKLGYNSDDPLRELRSRLRAFLDSYADQGPAPELQGVSRFWNSRFWFQLALVAIVASALAAWTLIAQHREAEVERVRLERLGMERTAAQAVAQRQADELRKHQRPLPATGIYSQHVPGYGRGNNNLPPFKVSTNPGANFFLKLSDWQTGQERLKIFIRAGEEIEVGVPPGTYRIKLASGNTWYGEDIRFGPDTEYSVVDEPSNFTIQGSQLLGHELRLVNVRNGNLRRKPISATEF